MKNIKELTLFCELEKSKINMNAIYKMTGKEYKDMIDLILQSVEETIKLKNELKELKEKKQEIKIVEKIVYRKR